MKDESQEHSYQPKEFTDEFMIGLFEELEKREGFRPYANEIEQFFSSRIWKLVEQEASSKLAQMFNLLLKTGITEREFTEVASMIRMMSWWLNLKENIVAVRSRTLGVDAVTPGGESWQERP